MTPPENYVLTAPGRRILPRPEAPEAAMGGFTAGAKAQLQDPNEIDWASWGLDPRPNGNLQHSEGTDLPYGELETLSNGPEQYLQQHDWPVGELEPTPNEGLQYLPQPNMAFGGYPPQLSESSPSLGEPSLAGSVGQSTGISLYTRDPSVASDGPTALSQNFLPHPNEPGMGFMYYDSPQPSPADGQNPMGSSHFDGQAWTLAHFAELDAMDLLGKTKT